MDKNRFNREVRPSVLALRIGIQGIAFDRVDLDAWADDYKSRNGCHAARLHRSKLWEPTKCQASPNAVGYRVAKRSCSRRGQVEGANRSRGGRWLSQSAGSRSEAHVRPASSRGRGVIRRSAGFARSQEQSDHDALLRGRTHEPDSGGGKDLRQRVPQFPRNHRVTATSGRSEPRQDIVAVREIGAPGRIRTADHLVRSQVLYPAELRARGSNRRAAILPQPV